MSFRSIVILISVLVALAAYLIGSVNFAIIFTRKFKNEDIRNHGSGNAGMTNAFRYAGKLPGVLTLVCDFAKGVVSVLLGYFVFVWLGRLPQAGVLIDPTYGKYIAGLFCFLGHLYPAYYGFKGGKGVLTSISVILLIDWRVALAVFGVFSVVFLFSRIVSLSSICGAVTYPIATFFLFGSRPVLENVATDPFGISQKLFETLFAVLFGVIVIIKHIPNIQRMIRGEEKRVSFHKK